jgi:hypothetical protein
MVSVAQLAEHWVVAPAAVGSNPITHPITDLTILPFQYCPLSRMGSCIDMYFFFQTVT